MSSSAEALAEIAERGELDIRVSGSGKNRSKTEQVENKHDEAGRDTRKVVNYCASGEEARKAPTSQ